MVGLDKFGRFGSSTWVCIFLGGAHCPMDVGLFLFFQGVFGRSPYS